MQRFARISAGLVAEILELPETVEDEAGTVHEVHLADLFHADVLADVVACPDPAVAAGWSCSLDAAGKATFAAPVAPPLTAVQLVALANARQRALAAGGFTVTIKGQAVAFATDEASLGALDRKAMRLAQPNPPASVTWQTGPATFARIEADDFAHAATLVDDFVQATFDALPALVAGIAAGTVKTEADVIAAAWPASNATIA
ncbi:hypothetical protein [Methylobacterium sp. 1973]|uniref:DUF4376 domain-containing protein n=1 Tax=Methylobacterium sp. 1973 TaxID=3156421 RepID=UPI003396D089